MVQWINQVNRWLLVASGGLMARALIPKHYLTTVSSLLLPWLHSFVSVRWRQTCTAEHFSQRIPLPAEWKKQPGLHRQRGSCEESSAAARVFGDLSPPSTLPPPPPPPNSMLPFSGTDCLKNPFLEELRLSQMQLFLSIHTHNSSPRAPSPL